MNPIFTSPDPRARNATLQHVLAVGQPAYVLARDAVAVGAGVRGDVFGIGRFAVLDCADQSADNVVLAVDRHARVAFGSLHERPKNALVTVVGERVIEEFSGFFASAGHGLVSLFGRV